MLMETLLLQTAPEWEESFDFPLVSSNKFVVVSLFEHRALGRDKAFGSAEIEVRTDDSTLELLHSRVPADI